MVPILVAVALLSAGAILVFRSYRLQDRKLLVMLGALRCKTCRTNWPRVTDGKGRAMFAPCPECTAAGREALVETITNDTPIDMDEAWSRKRHADFEVYYAKHEARQRQEMERVTLRELDGIQTKERAA